MDIFDLLDNLEENITNESNIDDNNNNDDNDGKDSNTMQLSQAQKDKEKDGKVELWDTKLTKVKPCDLVWAKLQKIWYPARKITDRSEYVLYKNVPVTIPSGQTVIEYIKVPKKNPETHQIATLKNEDIKPYNFHDAGKKQLSLKDSFLTKSPSSSNDETSQQWSTQYLVKMEADLQKKYSKAKAKQVFEDIVSMARLFLEKALETDGTTDENELTNSSLKRKLDEYEDFDFEKMKNNINTQIEELQAGDYVMYYDKVFKDLKKTTRVVEIVSKKSNQLVVKLENDDLIYDTDLVRKLSLDSNGEVDETSGSSRRLQDYKLIESEIEYESLERKIMKATYRDRDRLLLEEEEEEMNE